MLMVIDIGNTNIVVGLFEGDTLKYDWRIYSDSRRTGDEYSSILLSLFRDAGISAADIQSTALSSVVPLLIGPFIRMVQMMTGKKPIVLGPPLYDRLPVSVPESAIHEIGTDLVCNAVAAYTRFKSSCIVVDFGTALTFTAINSSGLISGVSIAPGLGTAVKALFNNTAQLPSVPLETPPSSLGTNTIHSIQSGIVFGYKGLVESLIGRIKQDLSSSEGGRIAPDAIQVIATGGLNSVLQPITDAFKVVEKLLTLRGLKIIAEIIAR
ncbi:MAG: type III pantothenate kinase [Spirochaetaceae bacterium]|jgi:type III pantothenate kinase|nr:type III pantothenate kinase [Spirochaetaceae bacterium]